jgi:hypothetical protein
MVTNPEYEPGRDKNEQYREHVTASLDASPWARNRSVAPCGGIVTNARNRLGATATLTGLPARPDLRTP